MSNDLSHGAADRAAMEDAAARLLARWARASERWWYDIPGTPTPGSSAPGTPARGGDGTGYDAWGVQTNQKYAAAMAVLGSRGDGHALARALAAYRFSFATHLSGDRTCTDGKQWGCTWISALGIERMMHGIHLIDRHLTDQDRADLRRVLAHEADWLLRKHRRGSHTGVFGEVWDRGANVPESNIWNGSLLWRAACAMPDHPDADAWREQAHLFLINGVSVPSDEHNRTIVAGKPVSERFRGANFFPDYALDHHGYLNVGYMAICVSNAAFLHFDQKLSSQPRPESLDHHQGDLWAVLRRMIFADARLARIGGDSRLRYTYCQEYLLPSLLYAADHLGDEHALGLVQAQLALMEQEAAYAGDGSFYGNRLDPLAELSPYYYTRLESDRANALGMLLAYLPRVRQTPAPEEPFEPTVRGGWHDPEHGAALHRCPTRFASFSWRAYGLTQGLCVPPGESHLAEWSYNLAGRVRFVGETKDRGHRRLLDCHVEPIDGGFVTCGAVMEGTNLEMAEGWRGDDSAIHHLAFAALPDGHTVVGLQHCRVTDHRVYINLVQGMRLGVPNDLFNGQERRLVTARGEETFRSPAPEDAVIDLGSRWVAVDGRLGAVGLYGARSLSLSRSRERRGGAYRSLYVEEICWHQEAGTRAADAGATLLDVGWAVLSEPGADATRRLAEDPRTRRLEFPDQPDLRGVVVPGQDGRAYAFLANFGETEAAVTLEDGQEVRLTPGRAALHAVA